MGGGHLGSSVAPQLWDIGQGWIQELYKDILTYFYTLYAF